jgi:hypothetical protein
MGFGPGHAEGDRTSLAEDDSGDFLELASDLVDEGLARGGVRLAAFLALGRQRLDSRGRGAEQTLGTPIEQLLLSLARLLPLGGDRFTVAKVRRRPAGERLDQPQGVAHARKPRHRFRVRERRFLR